MNRLATLVGALLLGSAVSAVSALASVPAPPPCYARGDFYRSDWGTDAGNLLTLVPVGWSGAVTSPMATGTYGGKVATDDWSQSYPHSNQPVFISGPGDVVHWTYDCMLVHNDGWLPATNIVMNDHAIPAGTTFEVIGDAPETGGWTSGVAATLTGDIWSLELVIATPGSYNVKFRKTGDWGINVGSDGVGTNADNFGYTTTVEHELVQFQFNQATGRMRVVVGGSTPTTKRTWGGLKSRYR